jgi:uncharacterized protein (DUF488 family)
LLPVKEIFTVGHSTRGFEEFVELLQSYEIRRLIDVRTAPKSRRMPHFNTDSLAETLPAAGVGYFHEPELGGWRRPVPHSPNTGWRSKGFQGYADHMETLEFETALERVERFAAEQRAALMCAEALWWRCHRRLIADALVVRGWRVCHIGAAAEPEGHRLTPFAVVKGERITYPAQQTSLSVDVQG